MKGPHPQLRVPIAGNLVLPNNSGLGSHPETPSIRYLPPIGSIIGWAKSFTGVPSLPDGWLECDGSVINDPNSPLDGQTLPDITDNRFLKGLTTSGTTGGANTHTHGVGTLVNSNESDHTHTQPQTEVPNSNTVQRGTNAPASNTAGPEHRHNNPTTDAGSAHTHTITGDTASANNTPKNYSVVWIMRIK